MSQYPVPLNPYLPTPERCYDAKDIQILGKDRSETFYLTALHYAQTLWLDQFPAKSLLLINRALSCYLPKISLQHPFQPYQAVAWTLMHRPAQAFIGNPRRHYQHLATRMVEPHKPLRTWRAWACWYLACKILPEQEFPCDAKQIREEHIVEPKRIEIEDQLRNLSPSDDLNAWLAALDWTRQRCTSSLASCSPTLQESSELVSIKLIGLDDLPRVQALANQIWPLVYPSIISMEQIHYMLDNMYALPVLRQEMRERQIQYAIIQRQGKDVGYLAWETNPSSHGAFLHKLYLHPDHHDHGLGAFTLRWVQQKAISSSMKTLALRVNINNHRAIRAYLRAGFQIHSSLCSNIGQGYVMDDHYMTLSLEEPNQTS